MTNDGSLFGAIANIGHDVLKSIAPTTITFKGRAVVGVFEEGPLINVEMLPEGFNSTATANLFISFADLNKAKITIAANDRITINEIEWTIVGVGNQRDKAHYMLALMN